MTTKSKLTELVNEATTRVDAFYQQAIALHTDNRLRSLADQYKANDPDDYSVNPVDDGKIYIIKKRGAGGNELFYDLWGLNVRLAIDSPGTGNWRESKRYLYTNRTFIVRDDKLVVDTQYGRQEMLSLFPRLTVETIEKKLAEKIKNSRWLKGRENEEIRLSR